MATSSSTQSRRPVLVCTEKKENVPVIQTVLADQSSYAVLCPDIPELCRNISDETQAVFLSSAVISKNEMQRIADSLDAQPDWSDLPIIISAAGGAGAPVATDAVRSLGNVLVIDDPFTPAALNNVFLLAFRSRERQRRVRDLGRECSYAVQALQESREQLEQRIQERTTELAERASKLRRLTGELILSEQKVRRRISKSLHDHLQQPMLSAKYRASALKRLEDPAVKLAVQEIEEFLGEGIQASRRLISELYPAIIHEADLRTAMEWLVSYMAAQYNLAVELHVDAEFGRPDENTKALLFDATRELLLNAMRHGKVRTADLRVRRRSADNLLEVVVSDRGAGFDPSSVKQSASGLGRIRSKLELMGGRLEIESSPGSGSRISIAAPLPEPLPPPSEHPLESAIPRSEKPVSSMVRLLIVDDHAVIRQGLSTSLGQEPDIVIIGEAADGKTALEKVRRLLPDVVLMDLGMPKMNGIEFLQKVRKIIRSER